MNRDTVAAAYEALAAEGLVDARVGRGTFVRGLADAGARRRAGRDLALAPRRAAARARPRARLATAQAAARCPLHALKPDPRHFPLDAFRRSLQRVLQDGGAELLSYGDQQGYLGLREVLAERLRTHGIAGRPRVDRAVPGREPGHRARRCASSPTRTTPSPSRSPPTPTRSAAIAALGLRAVPVPMRGAGADLDALDRALARPDVRAFYTMPTFHNPLGVTTPLEHRRELLALAARHGKAVIEDAYEMDLRYAGRPVPTLAGLDEDGLVVQLLSFSKSLFPGVRAGAVVARGRHVDALLALRHAADLGGALPLQAALADFVRSGAYDRHLAAQRKRLRARRDALLESARAGAARGRDVDDARGRAPALARAARAARLARRARRRAARGRAGGAGLPVPARRPPVARAAPLDRPVRRGRDPRGGAAARQGGARAPRGRARAGSGTRRSRFERRASAAEGERDGDEEERRRAPGRDDATRSRSASPRC